jgi:23S rRNA (uracil1939-C5)-methyltransferase
LNLTIEKMIYGGDGLSHAPEGKAVFLPFVLPGEEVTATVVEEKSGFLRATMDELLKSSPARVKPLCPYFGDCGGCHYQHASYESQLEIKQAILRETFRRNGKFEWTNEIVIHSAEPWNYRNRTRMKVRTGEAFAMGYHRLASHELLAVEKCPISSPAINRVILHLWQLGRDQRVPQGITEIEIFANHDDSALLLEVYGSQVGENLQEFVRDLQVRVPEIKGVAFFSLPPSGPGFSQPELKQTIGDGFLMYQAGEKQFRVSAGSFFQTNRHLVSELVRTVVSDYGGGTALDLYAGVGLFTNHLAKRFDRVFAIESSPVAAADLQANALKNVTPLRATTEQFLQKSLNLKPEMIIADPPRAGLGDQAVKLLAALRVRKIVYLSCDPTTLARDLQVLLEFGYQMEEVHLIDLFPQTFHIESMVKLSK